MTEKQPTNILKKKGIIVKVMKRGSKKKGEEVMFIRKKKFESILDASARLTTQYVELKNRLEVLESTTSFLQEKLTSASVIADIASDAIDENGNYSYQKLKKKNQDRRSGKGDT